MRWKRGIDLSLGSAALVLTAPVIGLLCLASLFLQGRPVFFRQERVGRGGRRFRIIKLRTMVPGDGPLTTAHGDPRLTSFGRWLRHWKLDELPQLLHVVTGHMSLVGPRPELPYYVARHARAFRAIAQLRPGVTGFASVVLRDEERLLASHAGDPTFYDATLLPRKLALERLYHSRLSLGLDIRLLLATACAVSRLDWLAQRLVGLRLHEGALRGLAAPAAARPGAPAAILPLTPPAKAG